MQYSTNGIINPTGEPIYKGPMYEESSEDFPISSTIYNSFLSTDESPLYQLEEGKKEDILPAA